MYRSFYLHTNCIYLSLIETDVSSIFIDKYRYFLSDNFSFSVIRAALPVLPRKK